MKIKVVGKYYVIVLTNILKTLEEKGPIAQRILTSKNLENQDIAMT